MLFAWLKSNISNAAGLKWGFLRYILLYPSQRLLLATKGIAYWALCTRICFRLHQQKGFFRSYPLIHMYQISCSKDAHQNSYYLYFYNREREAIKAYWHILVCWVHIWQSPPPRTENKQVTRNTELHVLDEYSCDSVNNRRGNFTTSSEKVRIESNLSVVAFTFEPPLLPHFELSNKDPVFTYSSRCLLRGYHTSFNLYFHN